MSHSFDAVVLIAHGARDARWMEPFARMRADLAQRFSGHEVALAYLEFAPPTFAEAADRVYRAGARRILVIPIFLSGGGHVANDVPELVKTATACHPDATFEIAGAIGEEREVAAGMIAAVVRLARFD